MSRVLTQPNPCEESSRSVAAMSRSLWSGEGVREFEREAAGLAMRIVSGEAAGIEQTLRQYEHLLKKKQGRSTGGRACSKRTTSGGGAGLLLLLGGLGVHGRVGAVRRGFGVADVHVHTHVGEHRSERGQAQHHVIGAAGITHDT